MMQESFLDRSMFDREGALASISAGGNDDEFRKN